MQAHKWIKLRIRNFPWLVCIRCGLVRLHNPISEQAARAECDS